MSITNIEKVSNVNYKSVVLKRGISQNEPEWTKKNYPELLRMNQNDPEWGTHKTAPKSRYSFTAILLNC